MLGAKGEKSYLQRNFSIQAVRLNESYLLKTTLCLGTPVLMQRKCENFFGKAMYNANFRACEAKMRRGMKQTSMCNIFLRY